MRLALVLFLLAAACSPGPTGEAPDAGVEEPADAARFVASAASDAAPPLPITLSKSRSAVKPAVVDRLNRSKLNVGAALPIATVPKSCISVVNVEPPANEGVA